MKYLFSVQKPALELVDCWLLLYKSNGCFMVSAMMGFRDSIDWHFNLKKSIENLKEQIEPDCFEVAVSFLPQPCEHQKAHLIP